MKIRTTSDNYSSPHKQENKKSIANPSFLHQKIWPFPKLIHHVVQKLLLSPWLPIFPRENKDIGIPIAPKCSKVIAPNPSWVTGEEQVDLWQPAVRRDAAPFAGHSPRAGAHIKRWSQAPQKKKNISLRTRKMCRKICSWKAPCAEGSICFAGFCQMPLAAGWFALFWTSCSAKA